jgi:hypothetical protein
VYLFGILRTLTCRRATRCRAASARSALGVSSIRASLRLRERSLGIATSCSTQAPPVRCVYEHRQV